MAAVQMRQRLSRRVRRGGGIGGEGGGRGARGAQGMALAEQIRPGFRRLGGRAGVALRGLPGPPLVPEAGRLDPEGGQRPAAEGGQGIGPGIHQDDG